MIKKIFKKQELITFRLTPDRTVNNRRAGDLLKALHDINKGLFRRINLQEKHITEKSRIFWDIIMTKDDISFYITLPRDKGSFALQQLSLAWDKSAIQEEKIEDAIQWKSDQPIESLSELCEMSLVRHNIFSLKVDQRVETEPLGSLLAASKELKEDDFVRVQILASPISRISWQDSANKHHETFKKGKTPKRLRISKKDAFMASGEAFCYVMDQAFSAFEVAADAIGGEASKQDVARRKKMKDMPDYEKRLLLIDQGDLSLATRKKKDAATFKTWIRIMATSKDKGRRESLISTLSNGFHDLNGDNELERQEIPKKQQQRIIKELVNFSPSAQTLLDPDAMILSNLEMGRLMQLPSAHLQDEYKFETIQKREIQIPEVLKKGIEWGLITIKGTQEKVFLPVENWGLLCRPQVILGKMGTGKSTLGARLGHLFPEAGFTSILMDTADGSLIDEARDALPADFPESHIIDLDLGNLAMLPPSDWSEMTSTLKLDSDGSDWGEVEVNRRKAANKLTAILIDFIDKLATNETTDRMERYLSAVSKVILSNPKRGIMEIILCLTNENYREKVLNTFKVSDPLVYGTIKELHEMSRESRDQIIKSIMSRLNVLLNNDYMRNTILQSAKLGNDGKPLINVRKWIDGDPSTNPKYNGAYFVGIRIPKSELMEEATDRLATFWDAKIWLAALSRYDLPKEKGCHGRPFVYIRDEPHQTPSAFKIHQDACREARKWGMKNVWLAHKLEDFDFMKKTLQDAGAQYSIFSTSKGTIRTLKEELHPFEEEELLQIPEQFYCVNKFAQADQAFLCKTFSVTKVKDRSYIKKRCSDHFGRSLPEIETEIFEKTKILFQKEQKKGKG